MFQATLRELPCKKPRASGIVKTCAGHGCQGLGQGDWAGLAPVPHHLFLHSLKFLQHLDRAREFGRDVAIMKQGTSLCGLGSAGWGLRAGVCGLGKADRAHSRHA